MTIILDRVERDTDAALRRENELRAQDIRLAPQRELEARIAEGQRRHAEITAEQAKNHRPVVVTDALRQFWAACKAEAEAAGLPFEEPVPEQPPAPPPEPNLNQASGPSAFGAPFLDREATRQAAIRNAIQEAERAGVPVPAELRLLA